MDTKSVLLWLLSVVLIAVGFAGTVLPALPGALLMFAGMLLAAWIDDFARIGAPTLIVLAVLTLLTFVVDLLASLLGAQRVGASRAGLLGSVIGGIAGLPLGVLGLILGPFFGAFVGEWFARRNLQAAARVGIGTWIGLLFGTVAKLALAVAMIGVFIAGLLL